MNSSTPKRAASAQPHGASVLQTLRNAVTGAFAAITGDRRAQPAASSGEGGAAAAAAASAAALVVPGEASVTIAALTVQAEALQRDLQLHREKLLDPSFTGKAIEHRRVTASMASELATLRAQITGMREREITAAKQEKQQRAAAARTQAAQMKADDTAEGGAIEPQVAGSALPGDDAAFFAYLSMQETLPIGAFIEVTEEVELVEDIGPLQGGQRKPPAAARRRTMLVQLGGKNHAVSVKHALVHVDRAVRAARKEKANGRISVTKLMQFSACAIAIDEADETNHGNYGTFPIAPGHASSTFPHFRAKYIAFKRVPDGEAEQRIEAHRAACAHSNPAAAMAPQANERNAPPAWEPVIVTSAVVDDMLATFGKGSGPPKMNRKPSDGVATIAFQQLMRKVVQGYSSAPRGSKTRDDILRHLVASPRLYLRGLPGNHKSRVRECYEKQQLSGFLCVPAPHLTAGNVFPQRKRPTDAEHDEAVVAKAFTTSRDGRKGRAAAELSRANIPPEPIEQQIAALIPLHPKGEPPKLPPRDPTAAPHWALKDICLDALKTQVHAGAQAASAGGPCGWTYEALEIALNDKGFESEYAHILVDILNGDVLPETARVLASSTLLGLPKEPSGVRPVAMGSILLKTAATIAVKRVSKDINRVFDNVQFGVNHPGGADYIIHTVRQFVRTGVVHGTNDTFGDERVVITIDFKNAFNMLFRQAMWEAVEPFPHLHGIFHVCYAQHVPLYVVGSNGEIIESQRGARQGTVTGSVDFSLALQPGLEAARLGGRVRVLSYLDDAYILARNMAEAREAYRELLRVMMPKGMEINDLKCELLAPAPGADRPVADDPLCAFRRAKTIKALGASISVTDGLEAAHLLAREKPVIDVLFKRLAQAGGPQFLAIARDCVVPKLSHVIRTHAPDVSRALAQRFDARLEQLILHWAGMTEFTPAQRIMLQLPRARGGLGFVRQEFIAPAAYEASRRTAMAAGMRPVKQSALVEQLTQRLHADAIRDNHDLARRLEYQALDGADAGLGFLGCTVHPDVFGALLRLTLGASGARGGTDQHSTCLTCPGCKLLLDQGEWAQHVVGCVRMRGGFVTRRHDAVAGLTRSLLIEAGKMPMAGEPRHLKLHNTLCGITNMTDDRFRQHRLECGTCKGTALHSSGPDILWHGDMSSTGFCTAADVTVCNPLTRTNANKTVEEVFKDVTDLKVAKYQDLCTKAGCQFIVLAVASNGHLAQPFKRTIAGLAAQAFRDQRTEWARMSAKASHMTAATLLAAERRVGIAPPTVDPRQLSILAKCMMQPLPAVLEADHAPNATRGLPPLLPTPAAPGGEASLAALINDRNINVIRALLVEACGEVVVAVMKRGEEEQQRQAQERRAKQAQREQEVGQQQRQHHDRHAEDNVVLVLDAGRSTWHNTVRAQSLANAAEDLHAVPAAQDSERLVADATRTIANAEAHEQLSSQRAADAAARLRAARQEEIERLDHTAANADLQRQAAERSALNMEVASDQLDTAAEKSKSQAAQQLDMQAQEAQQHNQRVAESQHTMAVTFEQLHAARGRERAARERLTASRDRHGSSHVAARFDGTAQRRLSYSVGPSIMAPSPMPIDPNVASMGQRGDRGTTSYMDDDFGAAAAEEALLRSARQQPGGQQQQQQQQQQQCGGGRSVAQDSSATPAQRLGSATAAHGQVDVDHAGTVRRAVSNGPTDRADSAGGDTSARVYPTRAAPVVTWAQQHEEAGVVNGVLAQLAIDRGSVSRGHSSDNDDDAQVEQFERDQSADQGHVDEAVDAWREGVDRAGEPQLRWAAAEVEAARRLAVEQLEQDGADVSDDDGDDGDDDDDDDSDTGDSRRTKAVALGKTLSEEKRALRTAGAARKRSSSAHSRTASRDEEAKATRKQRHNNNNNNNNNSHTAAGSQQQKQASCSNGDLMQHEKNIKSLPKEQHASNALQQQQQQQQQHVRHQSDLAADAVPGQASDGAHRRPPQSGHRDCENVVPRDAGVGRGPTQGRG